MKDQKETKKATCPYCLSEVRTDGLSNHKTKHCIVNRLFGTTFEEIKSLIHGDVSKEIETLKTIIESRSKEKESLQFRLKELELANLNLKKANIELSEIVDKMIKSKKDESGQNQNLNLPQVHFSLSNVRSAIDSMTVRSSTKKSYLSVWGHYEKWCQENGMLPFVTSSGNAFVSQLFSKSPTGTVKKKRNILQVILRKVIKPEFTLDKIRSRIGFKRKKHYLSNEQLNDYFEDLKKRDLPCYVAQYLDFNIGTRINAIANIRREDLLFLNNPDHLFISLPDSKDGGFKKHISQEVADFLRDYVEKKNITGYLFPCGRNVTHEKRSAFLGRKINRDVKRFCKKNQNTNLPPYTTHDFKRTHSENTKSEIFKREIISRVAKEMNHRNPYVTKNHYLNPESLDLDVGAVVNSVIDKLSGKGSAQANIRNSSFKIYPMTETDAQETQDSLFSALESKNIQFSDDLIFRVNDLSSELVQKMLPSDVRVYKQFKEQSRKGSNVPVKVEYDNIQGYVVKASKPIDKYTLISEYSGEVIEYKDDLKSDSIMEYHSNLVIVPDRHGNLARFLSGINNSKKRAGNVKSIKYDIEGSIHILLYSSRNIKSGEILYYDYNAGGLNEYDTSNFQ